MLLDHLTPNIEHSYRNYHCKGLDYINFFRSPELTIKAYLIRGLKDQPLVAPHDHAYWFETTVISGRVENLLYDFPGKGTTVEWHIYRHKDRTYTPTGPIRLSEPWRTLYRAGESYGLSPYVTHTVIPKSDTVVLLLKQFKTIRHETSVFLPDANPPSLAGLYQPFDEWSFLHAVDQIRGA